MKNQFHRTPTSTTLHPKKKVDRGPSARPVLTQDRQTYTCTRPGESAVDSSELCVYAVRARLLPDSAKDVARWSRSTSGPQRAERNDGGRLKGPLDAATSFSFGLRRRDREKKTWRGDETCRPANVEVICLAASNWFGGEGVNMLSFDSIVPCRAIRTVPRVDRWSGVLEL